MSLLCADRLALAQDSDDTVKARVKELFARGREATKMGDDLLATGQRDRAMEAYGNAVASFLEAYGLAQSPLLLYSLGQVYRSRGDHRWALACYRQFLTAAAVLESTTEVGQMAHRFVPDATEREAELEALLAGQAVPTVSESPLDPVGVCHLPVESEQGEPTTERESAVPATELPLTIPLATAPGDDMVEKRRWNRWLPWAVMGASVGVGAVGGMMQWRAIEDMEEFDREFDTRCSIGCPGSQVPDIIGIKDRALLENRMGVSLMIVGGVGLIAGVTMVVRNQPRLSGSEPTRPSQPAGTGFSLVPSLSPESAGVVGTLTF